MVLRALLTQVGKIPSSELLLLLLPLTFVYLAPACEKPEAVDNESLDKNDSLKLLFEGLLPSQSEEHLKKEYVLANELARTIERLDGIEEARVHLNLANRSPLARDPKTTSRAAILIKHENSHSLDQEQIKHLAAAAIHDLEQDQVSLFLSPISKPQTKTVRIGPLEVVESSALTARICLGGLLIICILLALGLIGAGLKLRKFKSMR